MITSEQIDFDFRAGLYADFADMALVLERANAKRVEAPLPDTNQSITTVVDVDKRLNKPKAWSYVAILSGKLVGFAIGHPSSEEVTMVDDPTVEHLALLMVDPDMKRRKVGSKLLDLSAQHIKEIGKSSLVLWTAKGNDEARQFYESSGCRLTNLKRISRQRGLMVQYVRDL